MICVSIGRTRHKMMIMECQMAQEAGAQMIELRLDFLSRAIDLKRLLAIKRVPMLATIRRREDGGRWSKSEDERQMLMRLAIVGGFDWVDIETDIAEKIKRFGQVKRIVSYHNPREIPKNLEEIFGKMHHQDADVLKVAVKIDRPQDMWRVMRLMKHGKKPTIAIAMGDYGLPTRILGARYGSPFTYAAYNKERGIAPGMFSFDEMKDIYHYDKINKETKVFAVIGDPIAHSMSPIAHNAAFQHLGMNAVYVPMQVPKDSFIDTIQMMAKVPISGYSVTMPHKEIVHDFADHRDDIVKACKAGNTLVPRSDGFHAYNTDYPAALSALRAAMADLESGDSVHGRQVLILGAGGTARTLAHGLHKEGALVIIANRSLEAALGLADEIGCRAVDWNARNAQHCEIIINCTPVGQHPNVDESPLHPSVFRPGLTVMDCVYNPETTMMIREARDRGCKTVTGVEMFIRQAAEQFKLFTGQNAPVDAMLKAVRQVISPVSAHPGLPMKPPELDDFEMEYSKAPEDA
ncbi:MAG TPA: shikimate dehydrogenase [Gemmatales bacterium]|nr:shikimate dehydrogenase [Gemmatales bacterium]HMP15702.1 shikimate dehydrogenase [Gemmatales bacterium]